MRHPGDPSCTGEYQRGADAAAVHARRRFLQRTALATAAGVTPSMAPANPVGTSSAFRFVFMTDPHVQPERGAVDGTRACIAAINRRDPAFVITGGDLIMDALEVGPERLHLQWRLWDECLATLGAPAHHAIGNHDVCGWSPRAVVKPGETDYGKKYFAERYGKALVGNAHTLRAWLKDYSIRLVLSGHGHLHERIELGGVTYLQGGAVSGLWWKGPVNGDPEGFVEVECRPDGTFRAQHLGYGWKRRDT